MSVLLSLDLGTEGARAGAFDIDGRCLGMVQEGYPTHFPRSGWAEQDPRDWWSATVRATRGLMGQPEVLRHGEVAGISVSTTASTVAILDEKGSPVRPAILWMDSRASTEAADTARHAATHPVLAYSGGADAVEWLVPKAMWLARHEPESFARAARIAEAVDYLTWRLTGAWVGSRMNATCKWNYDSVMGRLPIELYTDLGIAELVDKLPHDIRAVGEPAGALSSSVAGELGITGTPVVATGGIDAHVSLLACGEQKPGLVSIVGGTSTVFITEVAEAIYSPAVWGPYPSALRSDQWLIEGGQVSSGSVINWVSQSMLSVRREELSALTSAALDVRPDVHGLLVLDHFMGNRTPWRDPLLRGAVLGLTIGTTPAELYRATIEGVCFGARSVLASWIDAGIPVNRLVLSGGIQHNSLWSRVLADVLQRPLELVESDNLTLRAGAVQAAYAAGLFPDMASASQAYAPATRLIEPADHFVDAYDEGFARYAAVTDLLAPHLHALAGSPGVCS